MDRELRVSRNRSRESLFITDYGVQTSWTSADDERLDAHDRRTNPNCILVRESHDAFLDRFHHVIAVYNGQKYRQEGL